MPAKLKMLDFLLLLLLIAACSILLLDMFHLLGAYFPHLKVIVFMTSVIFAFYQIDRGNFYLALIFITLSFIYNPFIILKIEKNNWVFVHLGAFICFIYQMGALFTEKEKSEMANVAYQLDTYLRELEKILSSQTYQQSLMYFKRKHPEHFMIGETNYQWQTTELPSFVFMIDTTFYLPGKNAKGGVTVFGIDEFQSLEIHSNFNLSRAVKNTVTTKAASF